MATKNQYGDPHFLFFHCILNILNIHRVKFGQISISSFKDMNCERISLSCTTYMTVCHSIDNVFGRLLENRFYTLNRPLKSTIFKITTLYMPCYYMTYVRCKAMTGFKTLSLIIS